MLIIINARTLKTLLNENNLDSPSYESEIKDDYTVEDNVFCFIKDKVIHAFEKDTQFEGTSLKASEVLLNKYPSAKVIDAQKCFLLPGLVDPQVHFREPGMEYKEDIESGSKAAVKGGFTTVISMPNTQPVADNEDIIKQISKRSKEVGLCRVLPTAALSFGLKGEEVTDFHSLKRAGAIAITDDGKGVQKDEVFLKAMELAAQCDIPILDHSEDESLSGGGAIHLGEVSKKYNIKGIDSRSESVHVLRGCLMAQETGAHYHALHVSTKESFDHIRAFKRKGANVTCEVSPHHLLLCDEDIKINDKSELDPNFKMNPPLRSKEDRAASVVALLDGTVDFIATDHAPHSKDEKSLPIEKAPFGIIGLESAFPLMYTNFVKTKKISLLRLIELMSFNASKLFKLNSVEGLKLGASADLFLVDLERDFILSDDYFHSKSSNSPFIGKKLYGFIRMTIFNGEIVFEQ